LVACIVSQATSRTPNAVDRSPAKTDDADSASDTIWSRGRRKTRIFACPPSPNSFGKPPA